jgi:hypothetical protein
LTEGVGKKGGTDETPMRSPEGKKGLFAGAVRTSDTVQINLDVY